MNDGINLALKNIYLDSTSLLDDLTAMLESVYARSQATLIKELTEISEKMTLANEALGN